jgi:Flp pilus assembly protein CpaB
MPYARSRPQRFPVWVVVLLVIVLIPLTATGAVGTLWAFGKVDPWSWFSNPNRLPEGCVAVMASGMKIPAYTKITRDHLIDPKAGGWAFQPMREPDITKDIILKPTDVIGRVLNHEKPPGYVFTERDFFPKGTRAGLAGAIPPDKVSMTMERNKIQGISGLQPQDRIDLTASIPIEAPKGGNLAKGFIQETQMAAMEKLARVRVLAKNVILIEFTQHDKSITSNSITNGSQVKKIPVEEVVIAVNPQEVGSIQEALATGVSVNCVLRSGQPGDTGVATVGSDPMANITMIDAISGDKREAVVIPSYGKHRPAETTAQNSGSPSFLDRVFGVDKTP